MNLEDRKNIIERDLELHIDKSKNMGIFILPEDTDLNGFSKIGLDGKNLLCVLVNGEKFAVTLTKEINIQLKEVIVENLSLYATNKSDDKFVNIRKLVNIK